MVSVETDEVCFAWVCCEKFQFGLVWFFEDGLYMCMRVLSSLNTGNICILWRSSMTSEYLTSFVCTAFNFNSSQVTLRRYSLSLRARRGHYVCWCRFPEPHPSNRLQVPRRLQLDCLTSHKCNNTWMNFCLCCLSVSPFPTPTPPLICVKGKEKNNCSMV